MNISARLSFCSAAIIVMFKCKPKLSYSEVLKTYDLRHFKDFTLPFIDLERCLLPHLKVIIIIVIVTLQFITQVDIGYNVQRYKEIYIKFALTDIPSIILDSSLYSTYIILDIIAHKSLESSLSAPNLINSE